MSIEDKIREIASSEQFAQYPYIFDNLFRIDERIESTALPAIVCTLPAGGEMRLRNGKVYDAEDVLIGFFDSVPHDANGEDNAECYNRMKSLGIQFIKAMNESGLFAYVETWTYQVWCVRMANIITGVFFTIRVQDLGRCD